MADGTPWWQLTKSIRQGYLMTGCSAVIGASDLMAGLVVGNPWLLGTGAWFLALTVLYLASTLWLRRRERPGIPA